MRRGLAKVDLAETQYHQPWVKPMAGHLPTINQPRGGPMGLGGGLQGGEFFTNSPPDPLGALSAGVVTCRKAFLRRL